MLLNILNRIPIVQALVFFPFESHKLAFRKFLVLWILATSPVILAILLSPIPEGNHSFWAKLFAKFGDAIGISEQYVYAASFLSPVLYIIYERYQSQESGNKFSRRVSETFRSIFKGYGIVSALACVVLLLTISAYSATKTSSSEFQQTFLFEIVPSTAPWVYMYAMLCWYLSILDGVTTGRSYVDASRTIEDEFADSFSTRLRERGSS